MSSGSLLLRGGVVLSCDPAVPDLLEGDVAVSGGRVQAVGLELVVDADHDVIDVSGAIVIPGLVDAHQHVWEAPYLLQRPNLGLGDYFAEFVPPAAASITPEGLHNSTAAALRAAMRAGTTTTFDWCHVTNTLGHAEAAVAAAITAGARYVFGYGPPVALGYYGSDREHPHDMEKFFSTSGWESNDLVGLAAALRGPDLSSMDLTRSDIRRARELDAPISMHVVTHRSGPGGVTALHEARLLGPDIQFVHLTDATSDELLMIADSGAHVVIPPIAELSMGTGLPPLRRLADTGIGYALGVDSVLGSPPDMFSQMRSAAGVLRSADWCGNEPPVGSRARDVLAAATIGGARACWLEDTVGSITPGKSADLLVFRPTRRPLTLDEAYAQVVWMGDASGLESVLVAGQDMLNNVSRFKTEQQGT